MVWRATLNALLSAVLAPPCAACGRVLDTPLFGAVCADCWERVGTHDAVFSLRAISRGRALGAYEGTLREVIHALKYDGRRSVAPRLARLMAEHGRDVLAGADAVVPVPLHRRRQRERGFNQAEDLAHGLRLPLLHALRRQRMTRSQVELPADQRQTNVRDAFVLRRAPFARLVVPGASHGATVLQKVLVLVDDVATTGATLEACATVLKAAGAAEVRALTAARVVTGPP